MNPLREISNNRPIKTYPLPSARVSLEDKAPERTPSPLYNPVDPTDVSSNKPQSAIPYIERIVVKEIKVSEQSPPRPDALASHSTAGRPSAEHLPGEPLHPVGINLSTELASKLKSLSANDLANNHSPVYFEGNDIVESNQCSEELKAVLHELLSIICNKEDLDPKDVFIYLAIDDFETNNSLTKGIYNVHWDFFEDVFEMHQMEIDVPEFKRFLAYSGEQFKPTEYLDFTLSDLEMKGLHPKRFNNLHEYKTALEEIKNEDFKRLHSPFQCFSTKMLHRAPRRAPDQLFIAFQLKAEQTFFNEREAPPIERYRSYSH